jgi:tRNA pseudouridine(38-40) synthase
MLKIVFRICDSRKYTYFFPTYMLIPPKPGSGLHRTLRRSADSLVTTEDESVSETHSFWAHSDFPTKESELAAKRAWRVAPAQMEVLRAMTRKFEGTHNFHNFTVARDFNDRSNQRHMKKIEVNEMSYNHFFVHSRCLVGCGSRRLRRNRMDQCPLSWSKFHAASGLCSSYSVY